jgi:hypothetical protein
VGLRPSSPGGVRKSRKVRQVALSTWGVMSCPHASAAGWEPSTGSRHSPDRAPVRGRRRGVGAGSRGRPTEVPRKPRRAPGPTGDRDHEVEDLGVVPSAARPQRSGHVSGVRPCPTFLRVVVDRSRELDGARPGGPRVASLQTHGARQRSCCTFENAVPPTTISVSLPLPISSGPGRHTPPGHEHREPSPRA